MHVHSVGPYTLISCVCFPSSSYSCLSLILGYPSPPNMIFFKEAKARASIAFNDCKNISIEGTEKKTVQLNCSIRRTTPCGSCNRSVLKGTSAPPEKNVEYISKTELSK